MTFEKLQQKIEKFIREKRSKDYGDQTSYKMQTSDALFCAEDRSRNRIFWNAVTQTIKENKKKGKKFHVVDAWSWIGILWLYALVQGATSCTFIEQNTDSYKLNKELIKKFGYEKQSEFFNQDATMIRLEKKYDLLISETLSSDLESEDFFAIISHLQQFAKPKAHTIPEKIVQTIAQYDKTGKLIKEDTREIESKKLKQKKTIITEQTKKIVYQWKLILYGEHAISSGDCISLFNKREKHRH